MLVVVLVGACASASAPRPGSSRRACTADPAALAVSSPSDVLLGQPAPSLLRALSFEYRWVVLEQVFEDTDENSLLEIEVVHHGLPIGDRRDLRLFTRDNTKDRPIDGFIAESPSGRRIAIDVDGVARVVDTNDGREWEIGPLAEPPAWMHAQGPLYRHYYDGFRVEVRFVDEQRVAFWSRERGLELLDVEDGKRTLLAPAPGWLKGLWASPDWVLASLSSRPPRDPAEDERVYRGLRRERAANPAPTPPCDPLLNDVGTSRDGGGWLAVHLRSGTVSKPGPGRLWPAPWGLVRLDTQCELSMIVANCAFHAS